MSLPSEFASEASNDSRKSSISAVWQRFEFTFVLIIFAKLSPFIYIPYLFTELDYHIPPYISIVHGQIHVTLCSTCLLNNENYSSVS